MEKASKEKTLRDLQLNELEILKEIVKVCKNHNLNYYLMGGTFLGAIRHKGFIPWDDDIDISLPREDYEKFKKIALKELPKPLVYSNFTNGDNTTTYFARVENPKFKVMDNSAIVKRERDAWVDIFPLDGMPNNTIIRKIHMFRLLILRMNLQYSQFSIIVNQDLPNRPFHERALISLGKIINFEKIFNKNKCLKRLDKALKKYKYNNSKYVVNFMGAYKFKEMFPKKIYDETKKYHFETEMLIAPKEYDVVLTQMYGDYMKPPKEKDQHKHHIEVSKSK